MKYSKLTLFTFLCFFLVLTYNVSAIILHETVIPSTGVFVDGDIVVTWDKNSVNEVTGFMLGRVVEDTPIYFTVYVRNNGTVPVRVNYYTLNWVPARLETYFHSTFNLTDVVIPVGETMRGDVYIIFNDPGFPVQVFYYDTVFASELAETPGG